MYIAILQVWKIIMMVINFTVGCEDHQAVKLNFTSNFLAIQYVMHDYTYTYVHTYYVTVLSLCISQHN